MSRAALIYATKFMVKVRDKDLDRTMASMEDSILPRFGEVGFAEPVSAHAAFISHYVSFWFIRIG